MNPHIFSPGKAILTLLLLATCTALQAEVRLHNLFSDHMVLQQGMPIPVWGWAADGEKVTVEFRGQKVDTTAKDGRWMVRLKKQKAGGPDALTVKGTNEVVLQDVMVGEVWIASGQSNMEWPLRASHEASNAVATANHPQLRLFTVPKLKADRATNNVAGEWRLCTPESVANFSAVGYYFGRDLQEALKVPVGIIHTSWGGSPAEVWMSEAVLKGNTNYNRDILGAYETAREKWTKAVADFDKEQAAAKEKGETFTKRRPALGWKPTELYNGMIASIIPYGIQGAIWYQGESNAGRAHQYRSLFADMIENWRKDWGQGDFPFLLVQLAPFTPIKSEPGDSTWAELREAQALATKRLPKVGMAVITDVGEERDIHPRKKEPVGERLALAARGIAYGEKIVYSGPVYDRMSVKGDKAVISFKHVGKGLEARDGELTGFTIAGADRKFVTARAVIDDGKVVVSSPSVEKPVAVRYGWADFPVVNLWNKNGLPASPFRTDDFPMITEGKK